MRIEGKKSTIILEMLLKKRCLPSHQHELNALVELCFKIALRHVRINHSKVTKFRNENGFTFEDIAIDAITHLFMPDADGQCSMVHKYYMSWKPGINTTNDLLYFLQRLISTRVDFHLYALLKENDVFFSKILDSFLYKAKKLNLKRKVYFGEAFIILPEECISSSSRLVTDEALEAMPAVMFAEMQFSKIFDHFSAHGFAAAIPINKFVYRVKQLVFNNYHYSGSSISFINDMEVVNILDEALTELKEKVKKKYLTTGKLSENEADAILKALKDISIDVKEGGLIPGLYQYMLAYMPVLSKDQYKEKYHNILEYLYHLLKKIIIKKLDLKESLVSI